MNVSRIFIRIPFELQHYLRGLRNHVTHLKDSRVELLFKVSRAIEAFVHRSRLDACRPKMPYATDCLRFLKSVRGLRMHTSG